MTIELKLPLRTRYTDAFDAKVREDVVAAYRQNRASGRFRTGGILYVWAKFYLRNKGMLLLGRYQLAITEGLTELGLFSAPEKVRMRREAQIVPRDEERVELTLSTRRPWAWRIPA